MTLNSPNHFHVLSILTTHFSKIRPVVFLSSWSSKPVFFFPTVRATYPASRSLLYFKILKKSKGSAEITFVIL